MDVQWNKVQTSAQELQITAFQQPPDCSSLIEIKRTEIHIIQIIWMRQCGGGGTTHKGHSPLPRLVMRLETNMA